MFVDYTRLNSYTRPLSYHLPEIDELSEIITVGTRFFTNLDLIEAYYSLPLAPNSSIYLVLRIITHNDVFIPERCTFGLKNSYVKFQLMVKSLLMKCLKFIYLDDILLRRSNGFSSKETSSP